MYIYISKFMSDEKIENLKIFDREFKNFGIELYFSTKKLAQYKVNAIDIFFLDYELNTTMDFIDEYEMLLSANKKIIFLTDMLSPLNEFELTTMINMEAEFFYKELRRVFQKNGNSKVKTPFMDKRWKYQDIQNLTYLKNHVRLSSWPFNRLQFLDAKQGDFFTNAQYVTMQKLIELYIFDYNHIAFPRYYMPHNLDFIRDDEVSICQIDLPNICFNDDVNEFLKSISDSIGIENFPKEVESFVYREKKQLFIGDELYLYDALLNYFAYKEKGIFLPVKYLPNNKFLDGRYFARLMDTKIYTIASSIEDSINYYEPMTFTKNDANIISQIRERIDLNTLDKNIFEIFEYIKEHDRYNEEEYQIYLGLKKMIFDGIDGLFIPQKYISFNSFDTIIFENRIIYILPIEEYKTLSTQINKINLLKKEVQENKNIKEKLPLHYKTEKSEHFTRNVEVNRAEADIEIATNSNTNGEDVSNPILYLDRNIVMEACMGEEDIYIICSTISFHTLYQLSQYLHRDGRNRKAFIVIDDNIKEKEHFFMYMNNRHEGYKSCELDYAIKAYAIHKALGNKDIIFYYKGKVEQGLITSNASIFGFKHFGTFKNQQVYFDNRGMATEYNKYFTIEQIDLSDEKYDHENNNYALHHRYSTKEIYYLMLLNIFQDDELKKTREDVEKSNLPESEIWNKLYEFQKDGVYALLHRIEKYNGAILADDVGLGKTYQALAVAKYYSSLGKKVLVIAPKKLYENWDRELAKKNTATFKKDGFDYTVIYHTTLTSKNLPSGGLVEEFNFDFFDLIIVDEAHAFRNKTSTRHKELANILGNTKKVLFLTATPVNNSLKDLDNLIKLCTGFNDKILENKKIYSIEKELKNAQKCVELDLEFNKNFYEIVDTFIVTRDKKYIKNNYVTTIDFPSKKVQEVSSYGIDSLIIDKLYKNILSLSLAAYSPSEFFPKNENFQYREVAIQSLIINLLFKRFESSYESFESTLKKIRNKFEGIVSSKLKYHCETLKLVSVDDRPIEIEFDNSDEIELDDYELLYNNTGKSTVHLKRTPLELKNIIRKDIEIIDEILGSIDYIVEGNKKFTMLSDEIRKIKEGEKIVIFTTYSDTAIEIYNFLINQFKNKGIGLVTGQKSKYVSKRGNEIDVNNRYEEILKSFSPKSKGVDILEEKQIDILVATDVISEGQNLQDCSNILHFDIHWNPVRMIQRIGRIDRIGSIHKEINNIIFWPTSPIDKYIELTKKINTKFQIIEATGGTTLEKEAQFNTEKEQIKSIIAGKDLNTTDFVEKLQNATNKFYPYMHDYKYLDNDIDSFMRVKKSKEILMQLRGVFSVIKSDKCQITALISINNSKLLVLRISENGEIIEIEPTNLVNDIKKISEKSNQYTYLEKDEIKYYKNFFEIGILEIAKINKTSTENIQFICGLIEIQ